MNTQNEFTNGVFFIDNIKPFNQHAYIVLEDGTKHDVTNEDYIECYQQYNEECAQYFELNQEFSDGMWYLDAMDTNLLFGDGVNVRFRKAKQGELKKRGVLSIEKSKLYIKLWDGTKQELQSGTNIEINLAHEAMYFVGTKPDPRIDKHYVPSKLRERKYGIPATWQRSRVEYNGKKWIRINIYGHDNILEAGELARITY